ncbi:MULTISPECIES: NAD-dependent epimerase/dehydratase family protein [Bacillus cereus group]|uniref:NAD-dependent epimerase/dehydratase family protein n=1 Tax=Bacillus cereus group TaxID=86661 RepID=UPI000B44A23E|nr:NAD(P)-dependent oxidoreductase [Bacillus thuringiensis]MED3183924.1 NAD(P)-dependent oxidoreductase [Bacillus thuringiensis]OTY07866.1 dTDP-glucose 4,6-dehydratase [Bacillus thuringiensis serovar kim]OUB20781.1 dTDP-glucose 4,6-dehydratase [Bacillus thuringiensis serovar xiaguangiensis]PEV43016.1 NAD(P)-dependent oxidoreductase [Bacillus thuringiensis]PGU98207.1 NAD(P)-dependent oxidoreductase [Bacillus thuringiensis]
MKIFVAGATGVIGRSLLPMLIKNGHIVFAMIRNTSQVEAMKKVGAIPVIADVFNRKAVFSVLEETNPDVVIHQLTSLSLWDFEDNAKIRTKGTRNLVDAAKNVGVQKIIAQSISWAYEPGDTFATEKNSLHITASMPRQVTVNGILKLEKAVTELPESVILRYGTLYGPGTWYAENGLIANQVRNNKIIASDGISSFIHVEDAARATMLALNWPSGIVNIVDNYPATSKEWLPIYAAAIGAHKPKVQDGKNSWERGASNNKARKEYGWTPLFPSWSEGFNNLIGK